jgi:hypothetical protein
VFRTSLGDVTVAGFPIPADFPLDKLISQELTNICVGRHNVLLLFQWLDRLTGKYKRGEGASIGIEAGFRLVNHMGQTTAAENGDLASSAVGLLDLLNQTITAINRCPNNELSVSFSGGAELLLAVDEQGFDSYTISVGGDSVDVTKAW